MSSTFNKAKVIWIIELTTVTALQTLILAAVIAATVISFVLFVQNIYTRLAEIHSVESLLPAMQKVFASVLVVLLGLELAETMKAYFSRHEIRVEVILIVAIVAVGRHIIQIDFEHTPGVQIVGISALILSLTGGYFLVKRGQTRIPAVTTSPSGANRPEE